MKIKVLYVDDEPINLKIFELYYSKKYEIITAGNGNEGLTMLEIEPGVAIVISDMSMPGMSGIEFIKKAKEKYPTKKFYILTGFDITDEIKEALDTGLILKYFNKPFDVKEIESVIEDALK
ncbi:MAG TPA: response regulator [Bacteroidales bacterium]|nr:response regulator [Bacteroidales bacterium]